MTNNKLTDETLNAWKTEAKISLGETAKDTPEYSHHAAIFELVTELQERRKADEWIKCTDKMPNIEEEVLALWSGGIYTLHTRMIIGNLTWDDGDFYSGIPLDEITHWMPLPALPDQQ